MDTRKCSSHSDTWGKDAPTVELSSAAQLPDSTSCVCCSADGLYLCLGHSRGLSLWNSASKNSSSSMECVAEWLQDSVEITSIHISRMTDEAYLLGTVDDMGVARVFAFHSEEIHLLAVINVMEDINRRSLCLTFELSEGGDYGAASFSCNGAVWLEVYQFPVEVWLKELETAQAQKQDENSSEDSDVKWSPVAMVFKVKPPNVPAGTSLDILQMSDFLTHSLGLNGDDNGNHQPEEESASTNQSTRCCTHHFLLPCGPLPGDNKAKSQPGVPVAVCVWWSGTQNLLQYLLQRPLKQKQATVDLEPMPDVLWPSAKEILCSAVSACSRYVALGLHDAMVCVWDRKTASPLSVVFLSDTDGSFIRIQFVNESPDSADDSQTFTISLLLMCKSGAIHTVTTGRGTHTSTMQLKDRPKESGDLITIITSVPFLPSLSLVMQRNGNMFLRDVISQSTVCLLTPPTSHLIGSPCNPVYALNSTLQTLFIQGELDPSCSASSEGGSQNHLFIFSFAECDVIKEYVNSLPDCTTQQQEPISFLSLEENCNNYLQKRSLSVNERNTSLSQTWDQIQETAVKIQQKQIS